MEKTVKIFSSPAELAGSFADELADMINNLPAANDTFTIALSGGSTPELLFTELGEKHSDDINWARVHFFWGDERCVPPDDPQSNYGMTRRKLIDQITIPSVNIHRIKGEDDPEREARRYSDEIKACSSGRAGFPVFNVIILGLGEDGHTASIFPGQNDLLSSDNICEVVTHPQSGQKRITLTGNVINNADLIYFLVTGKRKQEIVAKILKKEAPYENYPASYIVPSYGLLRWYLDKDAAGLL